MSLAYSCWCFQKLSWNQHTSSAHLGVLSINVCLTRNIYSMYSFAPFFCNGTIIPRFHIFVSFLQYITISPCRLINVAFLHIFSNSAVMSSFPFWRCWVFYLNFWLAYFDVNHYLIVLVIDTYQFIKILLPPAQYLLLFR